MSQLDLFNINDIEENAKRFLQVIEDSGKPYDLVAVHRLYLHNAIIFDREEEQLYHCNDMFGLKKMYVSQRVGPGYYLANERFKKYEAIQLTNAKREYTTCPRNQLDRYLASGWVVKERW